MKHFVQPNLLRSFFLTKPFFVNLSLKIIPQLISFSLVLIFQILLVQSVLILNEAINGVVQRPFFSPGLWKLFNPVLTVLHSFLDSVFLELLLFFRIVVLSIDRVEVMSFPELLGSVESFNLSVDLEFLIVQFEVSVRDDVVVSETCGCDFLLFGGFLLRDRGSLIWREVVVFLEIFV